MLGCTDLHFLSAGVKMNGQHYRDILLTQNLLLTSDSNRIFTSFISAGWGTSLPHARVGRAADKQYGRFHTSVAVATQQSGSKSCGLYCMGVQCSRSQSREKIGTVEDMQQRITDEWECLDQHVIDNAVKQSRKPFHACVAANGGHSGHLLIISHNFCFYCHINWCSALKWILFCACLHDNFQSFRYNDISKELS